MCIRDSPNAAARIHQEPGHGQAQPVRFLLQMGHQLLQTGGNVNGLVLSGIAGMTLYTVGSVKRIPGYKQYAAVDGGMTDNPQMCIRDSSHFLPQPTAEGGESGGYARLKTVIDGERAMNPAALLVDGRCV